MSEHAQDRERQRASARAYQERRAAWQAHRARREELTAPTGEGARARREAYLERLAQQEREAAEKEHTPTEEHTTTEDTPTEDTPTENATPPHNRGRPNLYPRELVALIRRLRTRERLNARQIAERLEKLGHPAPSLAQIHRYLITTTSRATTKGHGSRE